MTRELLSQMFDYDPETGSLVRVHFYGGGYRAHIKHRGTVKYLGSFETPEEASAVYRRAAEEIQGEFALHVSRPDGRPRGNSIGR